LSPITHQGPFTTMPAVVCEQDRMHILSFTPLQQALMVYKAQ
jgi:hypothetical protein